MKWEVPAKISLAITQQAVISAILWFTEDIKFLAILLMSVSSLIWITTLWSMYEDIKQSRKETAQPANLTEVENQHE